MGMSSKNVISRLPNPLISKILSLLPTKEAASTSVLSKRWRFSFASVTNLEFEHEADYDEDITSFMDFVYRVLTLQGNATLNRFSLACAAAYPDPVRVNAWISKVMRRGVTDVDLALSEYCLPSNIFVSETLVRLKLGGNDLSVNIGAGDVLLPKVKMLDLEVGFEEGGVGLAKVLLGCHVLEELVITDIGWEGWQFCSVSVASLKRLRIFFENDFSNPKSVSFDTPNLEYLEYSDSVAGKYPKVDFSSLVEAHIGLRLSDEQSGYAGCSDDGGYSEEEDYFLEGDDDVEENMMVGNATDFFMGICNVRILYLSASALEVLAFSCTATPVFNNLIQLTVESNPDMGWDSLPGLLNNCPNLETLVFKGLYHKRNKACGNMCLCKTPKNTSYLSSSPIKVLKVIMNLDIDDEGTKIEQIKHFLEKMPRLEHLVVYFNMSFDTSVFELSEKLQNLPKIASTKCKIQVISVNLDLSFTLPSTLSRKCAAPPNKECAWFLNALN